MNHTELAKELVKDMGLKPSEITDRTGFSVSYVRLLREKYLRQIAHKLIKREVMKEREACAQLCVTVPFTGRDKRPVEYVDGWVSGTLQCASAIRSRKSRWTSGK